MAQPRRALTAAALASAVTLAAPTLRAQRWPEVSLVTMGPGDDVFSRFGHAALCVRDAAEPAGRCYNYGTADFDAPVAFTWSVLRGRGRFWVSVTPEPEMLDLYGPGSDRDVWSQELPLSYAARVALASRLAWDALPEHRDFIYHHYRDNCATRLRDHLDAVTAGALRRRGARPFGHPWRTPTRAGFASDARFVLAADLALGRALDRPMTTWEAMFLPDVLRAEARHTWQVPPVARCRRMGTMTAGDPGAGQRLLVHVAGALGALSALASWRLGPRGRRAARVALAGLLGVAALALWTLAAVSPLPELRVNECLLLLAPTDFVLATGDEARATRYARLRVLGVLAVLALWAAGLLVQPLGWVAAAVLAALGPWALGRRERATSP
jgi:hypothetical protein